MINEIDENIVTWAQSIVGQGNQVSLSPPTDGDSPSVNLYLLELVDDPIRHSGQNLPNQPVLRYLVTTHASDPIEAHRLLAHLLYAAMANSTYEVNLEPVPIQLWSAFQIAPRPAFIFQVPLPHEWKERPVHQVYRLEPDISSDTPILPMYGQVLGPRDIPLMNARVELPNLFRSTTTDSKGCFTLPGVPAAPKEKTLLIKARNREKTAVFQQTGTPDDPVIIQFDLFKPEGGK